VILPSDVAARETEAVFEPAGKIADSYKPLRAF
jgi:hypothetical protein